MARVITSYSIHYTKLYEYEPLYAAGVIDPTKVTRVALENAASIASMFITTECVVADVAEEPAMPPMGGGMGGGMGMM